MKLCQERAQLLQQFAREAVSTYDHTINELKEYLRKPQVQEPPELKPAEEEQAILDLWDDLEERAKLSTGTIAKMLDDSPTNGKLKRTLADMVRKGFLRNEGSGYERIWWTSSGGNSVPAA